MGGRLRLGGPVAWQGLPARSRGLPDRSEPAVARRRWTGAGRICWGRLRRRWPRCDSAGGESFNETRAVGLEGKGIGIMSWSRRTGAVRLAKPTCAEYSGLRAGLLAAPPFPLGTPQAPRIGAPRTLPLRRADQPSQDAVYCRPRVRPAVQQLWLQPHCAHSAICCWGRRSPEKVADIRLRMPGSMGCEA